MHTRIHTHTRTVTHRTRKRVTLCHTKSYTIAAAHYKHIEVECSAKIALCLVGVEVCERTRCVSALTHARTHTQQVTAKKLKWFGGRAGTRKCACLPSDADAAVETSTAGALCSALSAPRVLRASARAMRLCTSLSPRCPTRKTTPARRGVDTLFLYIHTFNISMRCRACTNRNAHAHTLHTIMYAVIKIVWSRCRLPLGCRSRAWCVRRATMTNDNASVVRSRRRYALIPTTAAIAG